MVCACPSCTAKTANRTPAQAKMPLRRMAKRPRFFSFAAAKLHEVPVVWKPYLFLD